MESTKIAPGNGKTNVNALGLEKTAYKGGPSTLCAGCGHDSISSRIIDAAYELGLPQQRIIKLSGIGCSSKSPAYFLGASHGINGLHGRMPALATGAVAANHTLLAIGVSGDGDTGSIGLSAFKHSMRRNVPMVYIVENNGVYGLTKGQFSVTADKGQRLKNAGVMELPSLDLCAEAIIAGAGFVARSFAGDAKQVRELLKAAMRFKGMALLDIISPCVTFNNDPEANKSYDYGKAHEEPLHEITFIPDFDEIKVDYEPGTVQQVQMHDGPVIQLRKLEEDYDPTHKMAALMRLEEAREKQEFITGLIYFDQSRPSLTELENMVDTPLALLGQDQTRPSRDSLAKLMTEFV
ncbi:MAG: 2-oxoacid:ferredoxin oxidoreductase subunit beta [Anaerolineae bacterium]|nr:2-oxoacid:ferredoxin oxidoreductase subunit beta [Anaerolineae bacterium]